MLSDNNQFAVIIIGGSYSGLAAGMALGRALKNVLIIDSGKPCNIQTPYSHNFLTQDGKPPAEIANLGKQQVQKYNTVVFLNALATSGKKTKDGFEIHLSTGESFQAAMLIFATGIKDILPDIDGFSACWGISVLHCPYCHGYEVRNEKTGILGNGETGYELARLISNWTNDLTLFTNGVSTLTTQQTEQLEKHNIKIVEKEIGRLEHTDGYLQKIVFKDGTSSSLKTIYARPAFEQHSHIPETLGCELSDEGYIKHNSFLETTVPGVFVCGDNSTAMRTVASAIAIGTTAGISVSKKMIVEEFESLK